MKTKRNALGVSDEHYDKLSELAKEKRTTRAGILEGWIAEALDRDEGRDVAEEVRQRRQERKAQRKQQAEIEPKPSPKRKKPIPVKPPAHGTNGSGYGEF